MKSGSGRGLRSAEKTDSRRRWQARDAPIAPHLTNEPNRAYILWSDLPRALGKGAGLVLPVCNTDAMNLSFLAESLGVGLGGHCVVLMDQAGGNMDRTHSSYQRISALFRAGQMPTSHPVENIWQFMRDNLALKPYLFDPTWKFVGEYLLQCLEQS